MIIKSIQVRVCRNRCEAMADSEMRTAANRTSISWLYSMNTDAGVEGHSFGFAGRGAEMAGSIAASALKPFFEGEDTAVS